MSARAPAADRIVSASELAALAARVEALERAQATRSNVDAFDSALLLEIAATGLDAWRCRDLWTLAETVPALRVALGEADVDSVGALGTWCKRVVNVAVNDVVLRRAGRTSTGRRWQVVRVV